MKVELEMYIDEDQESVVMEKVLVLTKKAEELERQEEREEEESKINEI
jgi:hypothetical protein